MWRGPSESARYSKIPEIEYIMERLYTGLRAGDGEGWGRGRGGHLQCLAIFAWDR